MTDKSERKHAAEIIRSRIGQDFDGEAHFTELEANTFIRLLLEPASPSPPPSAGVDAVAVKALPWSAPHPNTTFPSWHAQMPALRIGYSIKTGEMQLRGEFALFADFGSGSRWVSGHDTLDAAKAAAQADYEARIRSALTPAPTPVEAGGEAAQELLDKALSLLGRCHTVLFNMARENKGAIFNRWPISHEPLRADARNLLPLIDEVLGHD